jgi:peptidoglycan glycosyltransferase
MTLRDISVSFTSGERNIELLLLAASAGFVVLAWRALEAAQAPMPARSEEIVAQTLIVAFAGHIGVRIVAPRASKLLFPTVMLLVVVGLAFVTRLAPEVSQDQVNWLTTGVAVMVVAAAIGRGYPALQGLKYTAGVVAILLLLVTGLFGTTINGARLWIDIFGYTVQTTELIKFFVVVFLAGYLADEGTVLAMPRIRFGGRTYSALPYLVPLLVILLLAMAALALLRDLGSIGLLLLLCIASLYVATGRLRFVFGGLALIGATALLGYFAFDHAQVRIDAWVDPGSAPAASGYQTIQGIYAVQAGGVTGEGLGLGQPEVIPAATTDYIYSAIAEELGLAAAIGVVWLYVVMMVAGLQVALDVRDRYGQLLVSCIALLIALQAAVIIGGNLRVIPATGITLPFVSYGGSSLVVNFLLLGILLGVSHRSRSPQA